MMLLSGVLTSRVFQWREVSERFAPGGEVNVVVKKQWVMNFMEPPEVLGGTRKMAITVYETVLKYPTAFAPRGFMSFSCLQEK